MVQGKSGSSDGGTQLLGNYELLLKIYDSEIGTMWAAREQGAGETMADLVTVREIELTAKVGDEASDQLVEAWEWTADARHDAIVPAPDVAMEDKRLGVVSDYVEGEPLTNLFRLASVRRVVFPPPVALRIALDLLDGLEFLHEQAEELSVAPEQVFGGVTPSSILLLPEGQAQLLEPGLSAAAAQIKAWGESPKRAAYAAPEMLEADGELSAATDVFTVGVLLWEMLQNKRLFGGLSYSAVSKKVKSGAIERADSAKPPGGEDIPSDLADVVARALERDPGERYGTIAELAAALGECDGNRASRDEVAAIVDKLAGKALASRRGSIERALRGELEDDAAAVARAKASIKPPAKGPAPPKKSAGAPLAGRKAPLPPPKRAGAPTPKGGRKPPPPPKRGGAAGSPPRRDKKPPVPPAREQFVSVTDEATGELDDDELAAMKAAAQSGDDDGESPTSEHDIGTEFDVPISERGTPAEAEPSAPGDDDDEDDDEDDDDDDVATQLVEPGDEGVAAVLKAAQQRADAKQAEREDDGGDDVEAPGVPRPAASDGGDDEPDSDDEPVTEEEPPADEEDDEDDDEDDDEAAAATMTAGQAEEPDAEKAAQLKADGGEDEDEDEDAGEDEDVAAAAPSEDEADGGDEEEEDAPIVEDPAESKPEPSAAAALTALADDDDDIDEELLAAQEAKKKRLRLIVGGIVGGLLLIIIIIAMASGDGDGETTGATTATTAEPPATTTTSEQTTSDTATESSTDEEDAGAEDAGADAAEDEEEEDAGEEPVVDKPTPKPTVPRTPRKPKQPRKPRYVPGDL